MATIISSILSFFGLEGLLRFYKQMATWEFEGAICDIVALLSPRQVSKLNRGEDVTVSLENRRMIGLLENLEQRPFIELALSIVGQSFGLKLEALKIKDFSTKTGKANHLLLIVKEQEADELDFEPEVKITRNHFKSHPPKQLEEPPPKAMGAKAGG